jgi:hypothetical protein
MQSRKIQTLISVGSFLLGGVIGAIVQNQLDSGINAAYLVVLVLTITLFIIITMMASSLTDQQISNRDVQSSIQDITNRLGLKVLYQELKKIGKGPDSPEDLLAKLMREAHTEILDVGRGDVHESKVNPDLAPSDVRQAYYDSIIKRVEQQAERGVNFVYKRICQFPQAGGSFRSLSDDIFVNHCKQMILLNNSKNIEAYVKRTRLMFPIAFIIIDRQYLIISVDAFHHKGNTNERYMKGEIVIYDPQQELIKVFLNEWNRIENAPHTQTVTIDDF